MMTDTVRFDRTAPQSQIRVPIWSAGSLEARRIGAFDGTATTVAFEVVTQRSGFEALSAHWEDLYNRSGPKGQVFQRFGWLKQWADTYLRDGDRLAVVTGWDRGQLVIALPLVVERVAGLRQLAFMGAPVSQYGDALVIDTPERQSLVRQAWAQALAATRPDLVRLTKVRADGAIVGFLKSIDAVETSFEEAPFVNLKAYGSFDAYQKRFSAKYLKNLRRLRRRLDERGVTQTHLDLAGPKAEDAVYAAVALKRAWLSSRGLFSTAFAGDALRRFFALAAGTAGHGSGVSASLLTSAGEIANAAITVSDGKTLALHVLAYNMKFEKSGAGILHTEDLLRAAFDNGLETVDFLAPRHEYKDVWADGVVRVSDFAVPVTLLGSVYTHAYLANVRENLKTLVRSMPCTAVRALSWVRKTLS